MSNGQRRLILIAAIAFAAIQLLVGFRTFMEDSEGQNLFAILPAPLVSLGIGLFVWMGRDKSEGGPGPRRGRIMKGPWQ